MVQADFLITHAQCTMMMILRGLALLMIRLRSTWKTPCGHSISRCFICQQIAKPSIYETRQQAKLCRTSSNYITLEAEPGLFTDQSATFVFIGFESRNSNLFSLFYVRTCHSLIASGVEMFKVCVRRYDRGKRASKYIVSPAAAGVMLYRFRIFSFMFTFSQ
jgi:hypothetical protein